jgi:uncharacterized protein YlzI (FlbEa/FlbD family)
VKTKICLLIALLLTLTVSPASAVTKINSDGYYKDIRLAGKVKVVEAFPDIKVQIVNSFPDLKVQVVEAFPDNIGQWQFVEAFPDFTIQFVNAFPDIKIQYVNAFPGLP